MFILGIRDHGTYIGNGNKEFKFLHVGAVLLDSALVTAFGHCKGLLTEIYQGTKEEDEGRVELEKSDQNSL
jgi:hypothetical protein